MKKNIIVCVIALIVLFSWTLFHAFNSNRGQITHIKVTGYDPRDLLSGHYLTYTVLYENFEQSSCSEHEGDDVYLCLDDGRLSSITPGGCATFIKGVCSIYGANRFNAGIERFYIPEKHAERLDSALRKGTFDTKIKVLVTPTGKAYVKDMLFDGVPALEFAK